MSVNGFPLWTKVAEIVKSTLSAIAMGVLEGSDSTDSNEAEDAMAPIEVREQSRCCSGHFKCAP